MTGQMGDVPLEQLVSARRVLAGMYVEMRFASTLPGPEGTQPYEAIYHVGYVAKEDVYVLHLLDTFGPGSTCIVGLGKRDGDAIAFEFAYPGMPFTNRFVWNAEPETWTMDLSYLNDNERQVFATKTLRRQPV